MRTKWFKHIAIQTVQVHLIKVPERSNMAKNRLWGIPKNRSKTQRAAILAIFCDYDAHRADPINR